MATIPTQTHPLLAVPFNAATDFTVLADHCENFAETLIESDDPMLRLALCGRLAACLTLLQPTLNDPIPSHLTDSLTVDALPADMPRFVPDAELLCDYSLTLAQLLIGQGMQPKVEQTITGLLCELVWYFAAEMKAPRWLRTAGGLKKRGTSLSALSRQAGLASSTLANALTRRWPKGERLIAEALDVAPENIWPSRYR